MWEINCWSVALFIMCTEDNDKLQWLISSLQPLYHTPQTAWLYLRLLINKHQKHLMGLQTLSMKECMYAYIHKYIDILAFNRNHITLRDYPCVVEQYLYFGSCTTSSSKIQPLRTGWVKIKQSLLLWRLGWINQQTQVHHTCTAMCFSATRRSHLGVMGDKLCCLSPVLFTLFWSLSLQKIPLYTERMSEMATGFSVL